MVSRQSLTRIRAASRIKSMDDLTLGVMVLARMNELRLDLDGAVALTGISARHLRRIIDDEGFTPQAGTQEKLQLLGLSAESIMLGSSRSKVKVLRAKLELAAV